MTVDADTVRRAQERVGSTLRGKYRLDRILGIGGMAAVYAATHRNRKQFAVKMLHAELCLREEIRNRFLREGYAANSVMHPGAVAVLDDDLADDGMAFLVMELLEGAPVDALWEKCGRKLALGRVLAIADQLLEVLASAHAKGVVHRDLKPANLFVTHEGQLKVLDFGIARVRDVVISGAGGTSTGMFFGTPSFMAPEQALAKAGHVDAQTDLWATGATLFTLLAGQLVHHGENAQQILVRAATTSARSLAAVVPDAPPSVVDAVDRALAFERRDRWPSAEAMREAIQKAHLAVFGRDVSRDSLVSVADTGSAATALGATELASNVARASPATPPSPRALVSSAPTALARGDAATTQESPGGTTSRAMSIARQRSGPPLAPARRGRLVGVVSIAAIAAVAGAAIVAQTVFRNPSSRGAAMEGAVLPSAQPSPMSSPPVHPPVALSGGPSAAMPPAIGMYGSSFIPSTVDAVPATRTIDVTPRSPATHPVAGDQGHTPSLTVAGSSPLPRKATSGRKCNPTFVLDAEGNKIFKPECFGIGQDAGGG